jgi:Mn-dependent DtxR family transcriptional regulator
MTATENYLRIIYQLTDQGEGTTTTSDVAEAASVADASVSEAIGKLEDANMVCRARYKGFTLSPLGKKKAEELTEKHDILEKFFSQLEIEDPEDEADRVEHEISAEAVEELQKLIKD